MSINYLAESFYRTVLAQDVIATATAPFNVKVQRVPTLTSGFVTVSPNTDYEEIMYYDSVDAVNKTVHILHRGIKPTATAMESTGVDYDNPSFYKAHTLGDAFRGDVNNVHLNRYEVTKMGKEGGTFTGGIKFSGTSNLGITVSNLTETERDALSPTNGTIIFNTTSGTFQSYSGGAWTDVASGATPNASETVSGKVEVATQAEVDAGTEVGETGAILIVSPKTLVQNNTNTKASNAEANAGADDTKWMSPATTQSKIDYTRASDSEAQVGTDTIKFVTPKQMKDNYGTTAFASDVIIASSNAYVSTTSTSYVKLKEMVCNKTGTYRIKFTMNGINVGVPVYGRIYKNGTAVGTERTCTDTPVTFTEDVAFTVGDLIQIYGKTG